MPQNMGKRIIIIFLFLLLVMLVCILRLYIISSGGDSRVSAQGNTVSLEIEDLRGNIFDANLSPLTGREQYFAVAVSPNAKELAEIKNAIGNLAFKEAAERLKSGKPVLLRLEKQITARGVTSVSVCRHTSNDGLAAHILGYVGNDGHGAAGIEKAYDSWLYTGEKLKFVYAVNGKGQVLPGIAPRISGDTATYGNGVVLTVDKRIQTVTENAMKEVEKGAAVVMEVSTGKIRALVSRPSYNANKLSDYLSDGSSPLINRALCSYNVGSVFKPCIAAAALEQGKYSKMRYTCTGSVKIGDHTFHCNSGTGHGSVGMRQAVMYSCNTFFYDLACRVGAQKIYGMARAFGFGSKIMLANDIFAEKGNLTALETLNKSPAAVANFAIGQGDLLLSPVALAYMYTAIAGNGCYTVYPLVEGRAKSGKLISTVTGANATRAMSQSTAETLREYLIDAVNEGTGTRALPTVGGAGGKTASAQTGWKNKDGKSVTQGWFCGFFPAENPRFVVAILAENVVSGGSACAPVFAKVANGINALDLS